MANNRNAQNSKGKAPAAPWASGTNSNSVRTFGSHINVPGGDGRQSIAAPSNRPPGAPPSSLVQMPASVNSASSAADASGDMSSVTSTLASTSLSPQETSSSSQASDGKKPAQSQKPNGKDQNAKKPKPSFFDEKYVVNPASGSSGKALKIRVNRFNINLDSMLAGMPTYYVYSVTLPQVNNRDVTNAGVKEIMMGSILSVHGWATPQAPMIFTDWNDRLITFSPLANPNPTIAPSVDNNSFQVAFLFHNQTAAVGSQPLSLRADIRLTGQLQKSDLKAYLQGQRDADFNYLEYVRVFNTVSRHYAARPQGLQQAIQQGAQSGGAPAIRVGRNRLFETTVARNLSRGLQGRNGFWNSVRPACNLLQLQMNSSATAFIPSGDLVTFLDTFHRGITHPTTDQAQVRGLLWSIVSQLKVTYKYNPPDASANVQLPVMLQNPANGRRKRINALGRSARDETFTSSVTNAVITVEAHFNQHVLRGQSSLRYPHLPVANVGSKDTKVWVPLELLWIEPNQPLRGPVPDDSMTTMANISRRLPLQNVSIIENQGMGLLQGPFLHANGIINIAQHMHHLTGRVLDVPHIKCKTNPRSNSAVDLTDPKHEQAMKNGSWNLIGKAFSKGSQLGTLLVLRVNQTSYPNEDSSLSTLTKELAKCGVQTSGYEVQAARSASRGDLQQAYTSARTKGAPIVLVILHNKDFEAYAQVKQWGDLHAGVHTICLTRANLQKLDAPLACNLALKFNNKLGGVNFTLADQDLSIMNAEQETMVVGADVTHPGSASVAYCPSIAAVVASMGKDFGKFQGAMRLQESRREDIVDLKGMMINQLQQYYYLNNKAPTRIIFYRDGVSENQFAIVKKNEINAIREACRTLYTKINKSGDLPKITFIVCTKRHQTRFYPSRDAKSLHPKDQEPYVTSRSAENNFKPGLVVDDSSIRLPRYFDFFLQSQKPLQGTARPCHYFVIEDENGFRPDELQRMTFNLCWVYGTSLTPISQAAPAYYAHKLCERGRAYLRPFLAGRHSLRAQADIAVRSTPINLTSDDVAEDQKRAAVAQHIAGGRGGFWPSNVCNPVHSKLKGSMFFV